MAFWPQNPQDKNLTLEDVRSRYAALFARFGLASDMEITTGKLGVIPGEWVGARRNDRVILYFHGGGFVAGSPESHRPLDRQAGGGQWRRGLQRQLPACAGMFLSGRGA